MKVSNGGGGFNMFHEFMNAFLTSSNKDISSWATLYCRQNGAALIQLINDQAPDAALKGACTTLKPHLEKGGEGYQEATATR